MKAETLARLQAERAAQNPVVLLTRLSDGAQHLWPQEALPDALAEAARTTLGTEKARASPSMARPGSSTRTTRRCASSWWVPCTSRRPWRRWQRRSASR